MLRFRPAYLAACLLLFSLLYLPSPAQAQDSGDIHLPIVSWSPADLPAAPWPPDGASSQSANVYFTWAVSQPTGQPLRYDIYLNIDDPTPDTLLAAGLSAPHWDPPTFQPGEQVFWAVTAIAGDGRRIPGPVWSFQVDAYANPLDLDAMVTVPTGEFRMGCDRAVYTGANCYSREFPLHPVYLGGYKIDKYEVTVGEYRACVEAGACPLPRRADSDTRDSYYDNPAYFQYPVIQVSWWDAQGFCAWEGKRLPTEAEWEKAYRGAIDTRMYPWGETGTLTCDQMNFTLPSKRLCNRDTVRVGLYPAGASPYGAMDMGGNVFEWVHDIYSETYYRSSPYENPTGPDNDFDPFGDDIEYFSLRGGSFRDQWFYTRTSHRHFGHHGDSAFHDRPYFRNSRVGFRCAQSLD